MATGGGGVLWPFVFWGQNDEFVFLRVDVTDTSSLDVDLTDHDLRFECQGRGAQGLNTYAFDIHFCHQIQSEGSSHQQTDRAIEIRLAKKQFGDTWPRLTEETVKPPWLRIDFDKLVDEEDTTEDEEIEGELKDWEKKKLAEFEKDITQLKERTVFDPKSFYLLAYNLVQWVGYSYVFFVLTYRLLVHGADSASTAYDAVSGQLMMCQIFAFAEVVHPMIGLVKGSFTAPLMQFLGRNIVLFLVIAKEPLMYEEDIVGYLFLIWSAVEVVRYPFYLLSAAGTEIWLVTVLRYTAWIPLYPLGAIMEVMVLMRAIPMYRDSGKLSLSTTETIYFSFPLYIKAHIALLIPGMFVLLRHMYLQTKNKLGSKKKKTL